MEKRILKKKYYKITFELASPLAVGSGNNQYTDKDIVKDSKGNPYIPGSALAGINRSIFENNEELVNKYFGIIPKFNEIDKVNETKKAKDSRIIFYDANMVNDDIGRYHISKRDSVALDDYKTAIDGAKFDMEILEPGVKFITYMEQNFYGNDQAIADKIADIWMKQGIYIGAKTMRGYGAVKNVTIVTKEFKFDDKEAVTQWLEFDMYSDSKWKDAETYFGDKATKDNKCVLELKLKQEGGISIRRYTTQVSDNEKEALPDYGQLTVHELIADGKEKIVPVIPGTSWAGAFRHRMLYLVPDLDRKVYFGYLDEKKKEKAKSKIRFSETQLAGAKEKILSRNSIDRFSGGTANTALFTEKTYYGGTTTLKISVEKKVDEKIKKALAAAIADLHNGFLAVGGLTSIGRGCFKIEAINGILIENQTEVYQMVLDELEKGEME